MNRNWIEDFDHDNGCYENACVSCRATFFGHKRRVTCKICVALATATAKIEALEAKLAAAERLFVKCTRFDIYLGGYGDHYLYKQHDGRWYEADSEQYFDTPLEAFESLQKENTDA